MYIDYNNQADVHIRTDNKTVRIYWHNYPNAPSSIGRTVEEQLFNVFFWPTAVCGRGIELYVAGRKLNGKTIIQKWLFATPITSPTTATALPRLSAQTIYVADTEGRRDVVWMTEMLGSPDDLLVLFHDKREFWKLSQPTSAWERVASPGVGATHVIPELLEGWPLFHVREHLEQGAMYTLGHPYRDYTVTLFDSNLDGVIDFHQILTTDDWYDAGYGEGDSYVARFPW